MNAFFALALACTLSAAPNVSHEPVVIETSSYVVTDNVALWVTDSGKLKLAIAESTQKAAIEIRNQTSSLYHQTVRLNTPIHQTFDLSQMTPGSYHIQITIGRQIVRKTIQIDSKQERSFTLR